ncbi:MAG TPA: hypothetical protein VI589_10315, partial [Vicinamibacteria bacterium]
EEPLRTRVQRGLAAALGAWAARTPSLSPFLATADGEPLANSALAPYLVEAGFIRHGPGYRYAGPRSEGPGPEREPGPQAEELEAAPEGADEPSREDS